MEITELKQIGKSENFRVFLDGNYVCNLSKETLVKNKIVCGMEIDKKTLEDLQFESEKIVAFEKASGYLAKGLKSQKEVFDYLKNKGYMPQICQYVVDKLKGYKYIDDLQYCQNYVKSYQSQKGKKALEYALFQKGIPKDVIALATRDLDQNQAAVEIAKKYTKNKEKNLKTKQSLYRYLLSKGFDYSLANYATNAVFKEDDYE